MAAFGIAIPVAVAGFSIHGAIAPRPVSAAPSIQTQFPLPQNGNANMNPQDEPTGITTGPDGKLWFTEYASPFVDSLTPSGTFTSFPISNVSGGCGSSYGDGIAAGADGNLWFTESCYGSDSGQYTYGMIGRITTAGVVTHFALPGSSSSPPGGQPFGIAAGPDGNLWFTEQHANKIGRITTTGTITEFSVPTANSGLRRIAAGPDGNLWFAESGANKIGRITTAGVITEFATVAGAQPDGIVAGPDGNMWFTENGADKIGTMTTSGAGYAEYAVPTAGSGPDGISTGPGGTLWFTEYNSAKLGQISPNGTVTEWPIAVSGPDQLTSGPDGNMWYSAFSPPSNPGLIGRLPLAACGDLVDSVGSQRLSPGAQESVTITLANCGVPTLTNMTTTTSVASPSGCGAAPAVPSFSATLSYGQSAAPQTSTFSAPACVGPYTLTTRSAVGSNVIATTTAYYVVSNGAGSQLNGDFNGDGYPDLAVGDASGGVTVYYGSASGLMVNFPQIFSTTSPGMPSQVAGACCFSYSLATGDFNGDGYSDLAIGGDGLVILNGSPAGLTTHGSQFLSAPSSVTAPAGSGWGFSLASGDFNHDGFADLAIGAPFDDVGSTQRTGAVTVTYGSATGLAPAQTVFTEATAGMPGPAPTFDNGFGWSLTSGDFNHDGVADLAISAPGRSATYVLDGSASGLTTLGAQFLAAIGPDGGYTIAAGDFNHDGFADLAVGEPCANLKPAHGIVEVHYGTSSGLGSVSYKTAQEFWVGKKGMPAAPGNVDYFGFSLAAGDFNHDGRTDLAISTNGIGAIYVLRGGALKLGTKNSQLLRAGAVQATLGAADISGDGIADLAVGSPAGTFGQTNIYNGSTSGFTPSPSVVLPRRGSSFSAPGTVGNNPMCGGP